MEAAFAKHSDNIGDELNAWIWPALLGDVETQDSIVLGIGTLINEEFCRRLDKSKNICVMGTGAGYGDLPSIDTRWRFYAVRGKRTAKALNLESSLAVADSAYFLSSLNWHMPQPTSLRKVVVIPHHRSLRYIDWAEICRNAGVQFLTPLTPPAIFMRELNSASLVLTEAMHGAILSDLCRIPWKGFSFGGQFNADKWLDWSEMFDLKHEVAAFENFYDPAYFGNSRLPHYHAAKYLKFHLGRQKMGRPKWKNITPPAFRAAKAKDSLTSNIVKLALVNGYLSSDKLLDDRTSLLYQKLDKMRADLGALPSSRLEGSGYNFLNSFDPNNTTALK